MEKTIFGWFGTTLSLIYKLPQIYKIFKTHDVGGISLRSNIIQMFSYVFYIIHGSYNDDYPIMVMGSSSMIQSIIIVCLWLKYKNIQNNSENMTVWTL